MISKIYIDIYYIYFHALWPDEVHKTVTPKTYIQAKHSLMLHLVEANSVGKKQSKDIISEFFILHSGMNTHAHIPWYM